MKFNEYLKKLREERSISKAELARRMEVSIQYLVEVESGRSKPPTLERCEQIIKALQLAETEKKSLLHLAAVHRASDELKPFMVKEFDSAYNLPAKKPLDAVSNNKGVPLLKSFPENGNISDSESVERWIDFPENLIKDRTLFLLRVPDDSMVDAGMSEGNIAIIDAKCLPNKGDLVLVRIGHKIKIRRFFQNEKTLVLEPANNKYEKEEFTSKTTLHFLGVLRGILWKDFS